MANKLLQGKVIKGVGGRFKVLCGKEVLSCVARGKLHISDKIFVGDEVNVAFIKGTYIIDDILPRKNQLIRPPVSNIDMIILVIAPTPAADWMLVDKLLIFAAEYSITPVLCYNKIDLDEAELEYLHKVYGKLAKTTTVSAVTGEGLPELKKMLSGVVCLAGQSAVGKSTLLNLFCKTNQEIGDLSRIERGRNTT
ncbi:MAG: ribosome small subunit-dependent GTPase A, partial [Clostridia bacterium]|nr:ribosome small subunit-dependent GTPase A [Clostridia bacterium]